MSPEHRPAPAASEVLQWRDYLRELHRERDEAIAELRLHRYQEKPVPVPASLKHTDMEVRSNIIANQVDRVVGVITYNQPVAHVPLPAETGAAAKQTNKLEPWYNGLLDRLPLEAGRPLWYMLGDSQCGDGWGVLKFGYTPSKLSKGLMRKEREGTRAYLARTGEKLRQIGLPFWVRDLDPLTVWPYWGPYGLERVIEESEKPVIELERLYGKNDAEGAAPSLPGTQPLLGGEPTVTPTRKVTEDWLLDRYQNEDGEDQYVVHHTTLVGDKIVDHEELDWIRLPYFFARGVLSHVRDPRKEGMSVAYQQLSIAPQVDVLLTILLNYAFLLPTLAIEQSEMGGIDAIDPNTNEPRHYKLAPGEATLLPAGAKFVMPFQGLNIGRDFHAVVQVLLNMGQQSGLNEIFSGGGTGAGEAGYLYNSRLNAGMTQLQRIVEEHVGCIGELLSFIGWFVENVIKMPVSVLADAQGEKPSKKWVTAGPSDFNGYYLVEVSRDPLLPQNEITRGQFGTMTMEKEVISMRRNRESFHGIENPEQEERQILKEKIQRETLYPMLVEDLKQLLFPRIAQATQPAPAQPDLAGLVGAGGLQIPTGDGGTMPATPPPPAMRPVGPTGAMQPTVNPPVETMSLPS